MPFPLRQSFIALTLVSLLPVSGAAWSAEDETERKGVFTGDHVGCKSKEHLFDYYDAEQSGNRTAVGKLIAQRKCLQLKGRTYIPIRLGFVTAYVRVTYQGAEIKLWTSSAAVVESPPPPRDSHFNF